MLHYGRAYHEGSVGDVTPRETNKTGVACKVEGCEKAAVGKGYCPTHYQRLRTKGEAGGVELMRAAQGTGSITESGYRVVVVDGEYVYEHRQVMEKMLGRKLGPNENVHHRNGDRAFNVESNLELWSTQQPSGQRIEDKVEFAKAILTKYGKSHETFSPSEFSMGIMAMGM